jgi:hypothetical protein
MGTEAATEVYGSPNAVVIILGTVVDVSRCSDRGDSSTVTPEGDLREAITEESFVLRLVKNNPIYLVAQEREQALQT